MRKICRRTLLLLGVCLLVGVVSAWAQQSVVTYQVTSVPTTVASTGDSEVLGSVHLQVTNVTTGTAPATPNVLAQAIQIEFPGISCDNNSLTGATLTYGNTSGLTPVFNATTVYFSTQPGYDVNNSIVPNTCVVGLDVVLPNTGADTNYGLPNVGDWFQLDGVRARMEFASVGIGGAINATVILASSVGSGELISNTVQVASPFIVLAATVSPGVYVNCLNGTTYPATLSVSEPYQADFVDYTAADASNGLPPISRPLFGATDSGTKILITVTNVPDGVSLTFPSLVYGSVPPPAGDTVEGDTGDHLVLDPSTTGIITGPVTSATVLYDYTCYDALVCDTVYETFNISPGVADTNQSVTGVIMVQAQVVPPSTPVPGGVKSFTTPPNTNPTRPRWSDLPIPAPTPFITLVPCSTTLLFPWAVSIPGFDTGVVINNTTQDYTNAAALPNSVLIAAPNFPVVNPTPPESGTCTLYYFPSNEAPALYYTTPSVSTGESWATMLSATPFNGLTGYMIARCNFQYGHGYAAIGQGSATSMTFTEAYLPLVIPDPVVLGSLYGYDPSRVDWNAGYYYDVGENLAH